MNLRRAALAVSLVPLVAALVSGQIKKTSARRSSLESAPQSYHARPNPYAGKSDGVQAGEKLFARHCVSCHGKVGEGKDRAPSLRGAHVQEAAPGDLFWFLTNGNLRAGMPSWSRLPEPQRWQIVAYLKTLRAIPAPR